MVMRPHDYRSLCYRTDEPIFSSPSQWKRNRLSVSPTRNGVRHVAVNVCTPVSMTIHLNLWHHWLCSWNDTSHPAFARSNQQLSRVLKSSCICQTYIAPGHFTRSKLLFPCFHWSLSTGNKSLIPSSSFRPIDFVPQPDTVTRPFASHRGGWNFLL